MPDPDAMTGSTRRPEFDERDRERLVRRIREGLSARAAAASLGKSVGAVKRHLATLGGVAAIREQNPREGARG